MAARRQFGSVRRLPSGRYQARYTGPDGKPYSARDSGGRALTFTSKTAAGAYLARVHTDVQRHEWVSPDAPRPAEPDTFGEYAATWLSERELAAKTRLHYEQILRDYLRPAFGAVLLTAITPALVRAWHADMASRTGRVQRAHCYALLRTILGQAVADELLPSNPVRIRGASATRRAREPQPATLDELAVIVQATPARFRLLVLLSAWCALRFGEAVALTRDDLDVTAALAAYRRGVLLDSPELPPARVHVRRGVVHVPGQAVVKAPKSEAGKRTVAIPPHLLPAVDEHLRQHVPARKDALLFPAAHGGYLAPSASRRWWYPARHAAGRDDLRYHDLRHTGATLAAATGATLSELMARLGHTTSGMALRYQHASADRDATIAAMLSGLATVTPITSARTKTPARRPAGG